MGLRGIDRDADEDVLLEVELVDVQQASLVVHLFVFEEDPLLFDFEAELCIDNPLLQV